MVSVYKSNYYPVLSKLPTYNSDHPWFKVCDSIFFLSKTSFSMLKQNMSTLEDHFFPAQVHLMTIRGPFLKKKLHTMCNYTTQLL